MSVRAADLVFFAGGECLTRHGVLVRRSTLAEDKAETFTRSSTGLYTSRGGILKVAAAGVPRVNYLDLDGSFAWATPALLLETARTNGWSRSQELDHADWTKSACSISADATTAPDDTVTMDKVVENTGTSEHFVRRNTPALTDNKKSTVTAVAVAGERTRLRVLTLNKAGATYSAWLDLANATVGTISGSGTVSVRRRKRLIYNDAIEITVTFDAGSGGSTPFVEFALGSGGEVANYTGDGASGLYLWGLQFEADKPFATSYIPTVAAAVTRAAETFDYTFPHFSLPFTVYFDGILHVGTGESPATNYGLFNIGDPAGATEWALGRIDGATTAVTSQHAISSSEHTSSTVATTVNGDRLKSRHVFRANGKNIVGASINGAAEQVSAESSPARLLTKFTTKSINLRGSTGQHGCVDLIALKVALGEYSLPEMEAA